MRVGHVLGAVVVSLLSLGACTDGTPEAGPTTTTPDSTGWVVTGSINVGTDARSCSNINGVGDLMVATISHGTRPDSLRFAVADERSADDVVACVQGVGGAAHKSLA